MALTVQVCGHCQACLQPFTGVSQTCLLSNNPLHQVGWAEGVRLHQHCGPCLVAFLQTLGIAKATRVLVREWFL